MRRKKERPPCLWAQTERPYSGFVHLNYHYDTTNSRILQGEVMRNG